MDTALARVARRVLHRCADVVGHVFATWLARDPDPASWPGEELGGRLEHPWAFHQIQALGQELTIVEIGGGEDDGLRSTLAQAGHRVIAVGPGRGPSGGAVLAMPAATVGRAGIPAGSVDVLVSIEGLEHLPGREAREVVAEGRRMLRPGGHLVLSTGAPDADATLAAFDAELVSGELLRPDGFMDLAAVPAPRTEATQAFARCFVARKR